MPKNERFDLGRGETGLSKQEAAASENGAGCLMVMFSSWG